MLAIEAIGLRKTYRSLFGRRSQEALAGLDLAIPRGSAFGLIGLNGAGKTTFIKTILGVVRPTAGRVRALGGEPEDRAVRARIGYLPERLHLPYALTPSVPWSMAGTLLLVSAAPRSIVAVSLPVAAAPRSLATVSILGSPDRCTIARP